MGVTRYRSGGACLAPQCNMLTWCPVRCRPNNVASTTIFVMTNSVSARATISDPVAQPSLRLHRAPQSARCHSADAKVC
jgi:hypothetical protein